MMREYHPMYDDNADLNGSYGDNLAFIEDLSQFVVSNASDGIYGDTVFLDEQFYGNLSEVACYDYDGPLNFFNNSKIIANGQNFFDSVNPQSITDYVCDGATNSSFIMDIAAPAWVQIPSDDVLEYGLEFLLDVNATDIQNITYSVNDTVNFAIDPQTGIITNNTFLAIGHLGIEINASDLSNNTNSTTMVLTVEDTTPPAIAITNPANATNQSYDITWVNITITTDEPAECRYNFTNSSFIFIEGQLMNNSDSQLHWFNYSGLLNGTTYTAYYKCNDTIGNINNVSTYHLFSVNETPICVPDWTNTSWAVWTNISCDITDTMNQTRNRTQYDSNSCPASSNTTFYEYRLDGTCDYCTPAWYEVNTSCQPDDTITGWYNDSSTCYSITALPSDNTPPSNNTYSCDYCTPVLANTTWTAWTNLSCLIDDTMNQTRNLTEYDTNFCSEIDNTTFHDNQINGTCDFCTPAWYEVNTTCQPDDTITGWYNDSSTCYSLTALPSDNTPPTNNTYSCDYCTPVLANTTWSSWHNISCLVDDTMNQTRNRTEYDTNFCSEIDNTTFYDYQINGTCDFCTPAWYEINTTCHADDTFTGWYNDSSTCYSITALPSDNTPPTNNTYSCDYCTPDWVNSTWNPWYNISTCQPTSYKNQSRNMTQIDNNICNEGSPQIFTEYQNISCLYLYDSIFLQKVSLNDTVLAGQDAMFTINLTNNGNMNISNFTLIDDFICTHLNYSASYPPADIVNNSSCLLKWHIPDLEINESLLVSVNFTAIENGSTSNHAIVMNNNSENISRNVSAGLYIGVLPIIHSVILSDDSVKNNSLVNVTVNVTKGSTAILNVTAEGVPLTNISENIWSGSMYLVKGDGVINVTVIDADLNVVTDNSTTYTIESSDLPIIITPPGNSVSRGGTIGIIANNSYQRIFLGNKHAEESVSLPISKSAIPIKNIGFNVTTPFRNAVLTVTALSDNSTLTTLIDNVYRYMQITKTSINDSDIRDITISFKVDAGWFSESKISKHDIVLFRLVDSSWVELPTRLIRTSDNGTYYDAFSPGFSYFAIGPGNKSTVPVDQKNDTSTEPDNSTVFDGHDKENKSEDQIPYIPDIEDTRNDDPANGFVVLFIILLLILICAFAIPKAIQNKRLLHQDRDAGDGRSVTNIDSLITDAEDLAEHKNFSEARDIYVKIKSLYSKLPAEQKKKLHDRILQLFSKIT